jgi:hypothetical protein
MYTQFSIETFKLVMSKVPKRDRTLFDNLCQAIAFLLLDSIGDAEGKGEALRIPTPPTGDRIPATILY